MRGEPDDMVRRPRPEDEAVARVLEARLDSPVLEPEQERVDDELLEVGAKELYLLLRIAVRPVHRVERLDFLLSFGVSVAFAGSLSLLQAAAIPDRRDRPGSGHRRDSLPVELRHLTDPPACFWHRWTRVAAPLDDRYHGTREAATMS